MLFNSLFETPACALLVMVIVTLGVSLQALIGIGFGLLAAPLLFLVHPAFVPVPILVGGFCLSLLIVLHQRQQLQWRRILPAIVARLPGAWLGAWLLLQLPAPWLSLLFGCLLLLAVLLSLGQFRVPFNRFSLSLAGFSSGLAGTITSVGGPPMALVYQHQSRLDTRNELAAFFLSGTPISLLMLALQGGIQAPQIQLSLAILPAVIIGYILARWIEKHIKIKEIKKPILLACGLSASWILYQASSQLLHQG